MTRITQCASLLLVVAAGLAPAADSLSGPVAGYVAGSPKAELRAILGVPGSFLLSDPLALPNGVTRIRIAPGQGFALIERLRGGPAALVLDGGAVDHVTPIEGALSGADWVVFSFGAQAAVLCSSSTSRLQVITGLPDAPQVAADLDTSTWPEPPATAAVSDDGGLVLAASSQSVYLVSPGAAPQLLLSGGRIRSLALLRNGSDAVVADSGTGSVQLLTGVASLAGGGQAPAPRVLASGLDGLEQIFPSADGKTLFAARPGSGVVSWIDLVTGAVQSPELAAGNDTVAPVELTAMRNRDTFLISARPRQPAWIFYRDGDAGRVAFVPAVAVSESVR